MYGHPLLYSRVIWINRVRLPNLLVVSSTGKFSVLADLSVVVVVVSVFALKKRSDLYSVLSNIRTGPTDANAFRGHRPTTQKGYTL